MRQVNDVTIVGEGDIKRQSVLLFLLVAPAIILYLFITVVDLNIRKHSKIRTTNRCFDNT